LEGKAQVTLADNNSVVSIQPNWQAGMYSWNVEGWNQLQQQWLWYRVDGDPTGQHSIDTISPPTLMQSSAREAAISYSSAIFSVTVDYSVAGGTNVPIGPAYGIGWALSQLGETVTVKNLYGATLPFHLFQYAFFDPTQGAETVSLTSDPNSGLYTEADQSFLSLVSIKVVTTNGANFGEVAPAGQTLQKLNSGGPVTLGGPYYGGPVGPGFVTWALEWDLDIAPGNATMIGLTETVAEVRNIPEPAEAMLVGLGLVGLRFLRRRP
jgi:hypothetical protein